MSDHAAPRRTRAGSRRAQRQRTGRIRAVLALGTVLGLGAVGTMAYWTDTATMSTGSLSAGELDIGLDDTFLDGAGGSYPNSSIAVPSLVPGESIAFTVKVNNRGTTPLTYTAAATASGALATLNTAPVTSANRLQWNVFVSGSATNSGSEAGGDRLGTCSGSQTYAPAVLGGASTTVIGTAQTIATGGSQNICIRVSLPTAAPNELQNTTATGLFVFDAKQVGAP